jgi:hypothetical protein
MPSLVKRYWAARRKFSTEGSYGMGQGRLNPDAKVAQLGVAFQGDVHEPGRVGDNARSHE